MLSVKKKKKIKIGTALGLWLIGELAHILLLSTREIIRNYGISFGIAGCFFVFLNVIFVILLTKVWWESDFKGISLVLVGGWINLIDRIIFGYVRDYWQLGWIYNNLADWMIQVGVIIFLSKIWIQKLK